MNPEHTRKLWQLRFQKILELEQESFDFYKKILKEKSALLEESDIKPILKQILHDEGKHIQIARDLLRLVTGKSSETESSE